MTDFTGQGGKNMRQGVRKIILIALIAVFAVSAGMLIRELVQYKQGEETYDEAKELAQIPDFSAPKQSQIAAASSSRSSAKPAADPYAEQLNKMDFSALSKVNGEVFGWILIPGTVISYPLLNGSDNSYYLRHTWRKQNSVVGAIFLEQSNSARLSDFNTIIYGHNMNNGSMFGTLKKYRTKSYWREHPYIYITTSSGSRRYQIFAAYEVSTQGKTYQVGFPSTSSRQSFLDYCMKQSNYTTGVTPRTYDHILTLSTCTGHGHATRWVVQARLPGTKPAGSQSAKTQTSEKKTQTGTAKTEEKKETVPDTASSAASSSAATSETTGGADTSDAAGSGT
jgi:sortase B